MESDAEVEAHVETEAKRQFNRLLLMFDGDIPQIMAVVEKDMADYIKKNRVEIMKFAAACSGKQQPCDVMLGFLVLKRLLRNLSFKYDKRPVIQVPGYMTTILVRLAQNALITPGVDDASEAPISRRAILVSQRVQSD